MGSERLLIVYTRKCPDIGFVRGGGKGTGWNNCVCLYMRIFFLFLRVTGHKPGMYICTYARISNTDRQVCSPDSTACRRSLSGRMIQYDVKSHSVARICVLVELPVVFLERAKRNVTEISNSKCCRLTTQLPAAVVHKLDKLFVVSAGY